MALAVIYNNQILQRQQTNILMIKTYKLKRQVTIHYENISKKHIITAHYWDYCFIETLYQHWSMTGVLHH